MKTSGYVGIVAGSLILVLGLSALLTRRFVAVGDERNIRVLQSWTNMDGMATTLIGYTRGGQQVITEERRERVK